MRILWFTWKDSSHPESGGAEVINEKLAAAAALQGHEVVFIVGGYVGSVRNEVRGGYRIIRVGTRWSVYFRAYQEYKRSWQGWADVVIEEINTIPFMTPWYVKEKRVLLFYQLCREIWFYQLFFPLNFVGFFIEPIYLWLLSKNTVLTESQSTKRDLKRFGFDEKSVHIFPIALEEHYLRGARPASLAGIQIVLSLGAIRPMKRTIHQIQAFERAVDSGFPGCLIVAGQPIGSYGEKVRRYCLSSRWREKIHFTGAVSSQKKMELYQASDLILVTSVKEGWGLIVTEAGSQGTPAAVYDVDGLRDSVQNGKTGLIVPNGNIEALSKAILRLHRDERLFTSMRARAVQYARTYTSQRMYSKFMDILECI